MENISDILLAWFAREGRDLPWRHTRDPYRIWLSEVILQQTRVAQGMDYYLRFTERFPDVVALAAAPEDEVLKLWQGLGYYSRARNLHAAARQVVTQFGGQFPTTYAAVRSLRGVGEYTAAAVCSIAYGMPYAVLDGNVFRFLSRLFDVDTAVDSTEGKRAFAALAQSQLDVNEPGRYNQAIMDFGALQCTPTQPRCGDCPLSDRCLALAAGSVALRPVKQGHTRVRDRWFNYLHITYGDSTLLHRRTSGDIWQGLYEFPMIESSSAIDFVALSATNEFQRFVGNAPWHLVRSIAMAKHQLSHQSLHAVFHRIEIGVPHSGDTSDNSVTTQFSNNSACDTSLAVHESCGIGVDSPEDPLSAASLEALELIAVPTSSLADYAIPRLIDRYLIKYPM